MAVELYVVVHHHLALLFVAKVIADGEDPGLPFGFLLDDGYNASQILGIILRGI